MSEDIRIYEAGVRTETGRYSKFITSSVKAEVDDYINIMKDTVSDDHEIVFYEKLYRILSTVPYIIKRK